MSPRVIVIGAGSTGAAVAHDLALRGLDVVVVERGEVASGTTGRNHCLLHSGGRYCVDDQESAVECIEENMILREIMPHAMELNDGLFVGITDDDLEYKELFLEGCETCGIPAEELAPDQALALEPNLNPDLQVAIRVPDGVFEPLRMCMSFLATAKKNGARVHTYTEVRGLLIGDRGGVTGVQVWDRTRDRDFEVGADIVVNAAGPWAEDIAAMAGIDVPVQPTPGIMVSMEGRFANMVINRLNYASDGDIVVPQRETSIIGTTSWEVEDADYISLLEDHRELMYARGAELVPELADAEPRGVFAVARPLISRPGGEEERELSRTFECFDHINEGVEGFVTVSGGKTTTARAMAETTADVVCEKLGLDAPCLTKDTVLSSYRGYYLS